MIQQEINYTKLIYYAPYTYATHALHTKKIWQHTNNCEQYCYQ